MLCHSESQNFYLANNFADISPNINFLKLAWAYSESVLYQTLFLHFLIIKRKIIKQMV